MLPQDVGQRVGKLLDAHVLCSTMMYSPSVPQMSYQRVLVDEATQATEVDSLVALMRGARQVVMIGEEKQLPPSVKGREAEALHMGQSLFHHLIRDKRSAIVDLVSQYRMIPIISYFPNKYLYNSRLIDAKGYGGFAVPGGFPWPKHNEPLCFVSTSSVEKKHERSTFNVMEAMVISVLVPYLIEGGTPANDIGIITGYRAQTILLEELVRNEDIEIGSVDQFQGIEKSVILLSTVRANEHASIGLLSDERRMNVATTRPRCGLIVVGNRETFKPSFSLWNDWIAWNDMKGYHLNASDVFNVQFFSREAMESAEARMHAAIAQEKNEKSSHCAGHD